MSTQHPDNVSLPFFCKDTVVGGDDEVEEAYYAFTHLGIEEQMWDCEGKEVDAHVVRKLLTKDPEYFAAHPLGRDRFLTLRVPNPEVEKAEAKVLLETLEGIPRSHDAQAAMIGDDVSPIFEVILPMATSAASLDRVYRYYRDVVAAKEGIVLSGDGMTVGEWCGPIRPQAIEVIPLFEDWDRMLNAADIVRDYCTDKGITSIRVFLARSDPALNYGLLPAVVLVKAALDRLQALESEGIDVFPIIGVGSCPFRGGLTPSTVDGTVVEYPSVQTYTLQSAFKYDHPFESVRTAVAALKETQRARAHELPDEVIEIARRAASAYQESIGDIAPLVRRVSRYIPSRRRRKLHIGLFGYSRTVGSVSLPRAIAFCAAMYSVGLPPELLGLAGLSDSELDRVREVYEGLNTDLDRAASYFNPAVLELLPEGFIDRLPAWVFDVGVDEAHKAETDRVITALREERFDGLVEDVLRAAQVRRFLG